jgi:hypothetical protein
MSDPVSSEDTVLLEQFTQKALGDGFHKTMENCINHLRQKMGKEKKEYDKADMPAMFAEGFEMVQKLAEGKSSPMNDFIVQLVQSELNNGSDASSEEETPQMSMEAKFEEIAMRKEQNQQAFDVDGLQSLRAPGQTTTTKPPALAFDVIKMLDNVSRITGEDMITVLLNVHKIVDVVKDKYADEMNHE